MSGVHGGDALEYERLKEVGAVLPAPPLEPSIDVNGTTEQHEHLATKQAPPFET